MTQAANGVLLPLPERIRRFIDGVLAGCLDIGAVWSIGHELAAIARPDTRHATLLAFAGAAGLARLRKSEHLHCAELQLLVVVDGDAFASAWGAAWSGSLARWGWRQTSRHEAHYDEPRWAGEQGGGAVVRVGRKALLVRMGV